MSGHCCRVNFFPVVLLPMLSHWWWSRHMADDARINNSLSNSIYLGSCLRDVETRENISRYLVNKANKNNFDWNLLKFFYVVVICHASERRNWTKIRSFEAWRRRARNCDQPNWNWAQTNSSRGIISCQVWQMRWCFVKRILWIEMQKQRDVSSKRKPNDDAPSSTAEKCSR